MPEPKDLLSDLLRTDPRYRPEAYAFVFDALKYAHDELGMGQPVPSESGGKTKKESPDESETEGESEAPQRHLTGQELCEAIRQYALDQFGYMAKCVLNNWGVQATHDFGEIVFNLIKIGYMRKTKQDRLQDFDDVYDFDLELRQKFRISAPE